MKKKSCSLCKKKVGLFGFLCKCNKTYCSLHRLPEQHNCNTTEGKETIKLPKMESVKLEKI